MKSLLQFVGDSPTIKHYINPYEYARLVEEASRAGSIGEPVVLVEGARVAQSPTRDEYAGDCSSVYCLLHKRYESARYDIEVGGAPGKAVVEVNSGSLFSAVGLNLVVSSSGLYVLELNLNTKGSLSLSLTLDAEPGSRLLLRVKAGEGLASYLRLASRLGCCASERAVLVESSRVLKVEELVSVDSASLNEKAVVLALGRSVVDVDVLGRARGDGPALHVRQLLVSLGESTAAARGTLVAEEGSKEGSLVYGIEALQLGGLALMQPRLEVRTNNVAEARHYARNVKLGTEQLFYLVSRGLDPREASMLFVRGLVKEGLNDAALSNTLVEEALRHVAPHLEA
ncbi:SufD family Fe-S cluster assembly protein [Thermogladius sp. KZ2Tp1]|uniref:SufD family Fe-S cluster assembly protein n=1 Tax=Thermogladius sp. KZ2Tp1 TaxID=3136289 RepID=UPI003DAA266F